MSKRIGFFTMCSHIYNDLGIVDLLWFISPIKRLHDYDTGDIRYKLFIPSKDNEGNFAWASIGE